MNNYIFFKTRHNIPKSLLCRAIAFLLTIGLFIVPSINAKPYTSEFDSLSTRFEQTFFMYGGKSNELIEEMYNISHNSPDSVSLLAQCIYREALLSYAQGTIDSTLTDRIRKRIEFTNRQVYPYESALLDFSLGAHLSATGNYSEAFSLSLQASETFKSFNDSTMIAKTLNVLGTICSHISLFGMSKNYYEEAISWITSDNPEYYRIQHNLFRLNLLNTDLDIMIDSLTTFSSVLENRRDTSMMITSYLNLGACYLKMFENEKAYFYWDKAEDLIEKIDNPRFNSSLYQNMGAYYILVDNDYKQGLEYFNKSVRISEQNRNLVHLSSLYNFISDIYDETNNIDSAYHYLRKHQDLSQQLILSPKAIEAYQDYVSAHLETADIKYKVAQKDAEIRRRQIIVILMIAISLLLLLILLAVFVQQQKRKKEIENRELSKQLEHEKKIQQIQKEKQDEIIEAKTREITSYSLLLSNKNNILKQVLDLNGQIRKDKDNTNDVTKKIDKLIQSNFNVDTEWKDFKMHFDKVHPSFFDKLKTQCPELTENNLRICAYFKIGMSTKQIAQILHISPSSVSIHRHRLKKKLGLNESDDLDAFIRSL
ncbi:LuxR family transcriptional regulator [Bacteroidales bacterium OttesenSCG-928-I14]|nr:LuxR family transcriptional regulator [Bacteroidales bacterium OttesenSCG-928-I14]